MTIVAHIIAMVTVVVRIGRLLSIETEDKINTIKNSELQTRFFLFIYPIITKVMG